MKSLRTSLRPIQRLLQSRRLAADDADSRRGDTGVLDGFHITPLGDSDVPQRSREDAIATFNFLNAEGRYVAAGLYPPDDMVVTDAEYGRVMNLLKGWDTLDENPLLMGLNDSLNHTEDLIKKLWSGKGDFKAVRDRILASPEQREAMYVDALEKRKRKLLSDKSDES
ncbi:hypothetical protein ANCCAN_06061 [Ancylostoma caninum]|uniref:Uncharacterized protein n=1 Tax=Ancylostoma caninum TaxID=29170 RepID=A0A368GXZ9_ANCCA|nr:hypothetical protein ANCCAN_06061 [Ancylostoma caninum]